MDKETYFNLLREAASRQEESEIMLDAYFAHQEKIKEAAIFLETSYKIDEDEALRVVLSGFKNVILHAENYADFERTVEEELRFRSLEIFCTMLLYRMLPESKLRKLVEENDALAKYVLTSRPSFIKTVKTKLKEGKEGAAKFNRYTGTKVDLILPIKPLFQELKNTGGLSNGQQGFCSRGAAIFQ